MTSRMHVYFMSLIATAFIALYCTPFETRPWVLAAFVIFLFPAQILVWRLSYQRKAKDFFFCISFLALNLILKHYWQYSDSIFYATSLMMASVLRYRVFFGITVSAAALEVLRENFYGAESAEDVAFRYLLFFVTGTLTHVLLRDEIKRKDVFRKELDDLKYGIHQVEEISESAAERAADAAVALDESLQNLLQVVYNVFKPDAALFWQFLPEKNALRLRHVIGGSEGAIKKDMMVALGEGPVGWSALNKKAFFQQNRDEGISYAPKRGKPSIKSLLAVPVLEKDRLEGVLTLESPHLNYFAADAEQGLTSFAAQIAEMIRMARLAREREERAFEFQAFYRASKELASLIDFQEIIQKLHVLCAEIVSFDFSAVVIMQENQERYSLYEWTSLKEETPQVLDLPNDGRTWISWFLNQREEPLIISESQLKLQDMPLMAEAEELQNLVTFLAVPMRHQQKCIGALLLGSDHHDAFNSHQSRIISILCNQAAVSLENSAIIQKMEELAITDGLTGLYNHRYFQDSLQKEMERADRQKQNLSLLIMDIDHFKGFNDSFGHPAGDFVLKSLAQLLRSNARKVDVLARYGGEEFAALLPGIDPKNARKTAERWRKSVQRTTFKWDSKSFAVTLSIGYATFPADASTKVELIEKADRALYDAKENGRNQVRHVRDSDPKASSLFG